MVSLPEHEVLHTNKERLDIWLQVGLREVWTSFHTPDVLIRMTYFSNFLFNNPLYPQKLEKTQTNFMYNQSLSQWDNMTGRTSKQLLLNCRYESLTLLIHFHDFYLVLFLLSYLVCLQEANLRLQALPLIFMHKLCFIAQRISPKYTDWVHWSKTNYKNCSNPSSSLQFTMFYKE